MSAEWNLSTSLERAAKQFGLPKEELWYQEHRILYEFKTRAHQFIPSLPDTREHIEWLSLAQHYGGPTRLLDFTKSFYIAAFFAMESATENACAWGINEIWITKQTINKGRAKLNFEEEYPLNQVPILRYGESFINNSEYTANLVIKIVPPRLNERLAVQRGLFLFPCNIRNTFESNLCSTFEFPFDALKGNAIPIKPDEIAQGSGLAIEVIKISLPRKWHRDAMYDLYSMNIDSASLFPRLDGFAKSLKLFMRQSDHQKDQP